HHHEARERSELPVGGQEILAVVDHGAKVGGRRRHAQAEVAERDDGHDVLDDVGHGIDDRLGDDVRQQVAAHDADVAQAARLRGEDIVLPFGHQDLAADDPRVRDPAHQRDRDVDAALTGAEHEHQRDEQHVERERDHDVHYAHDHGVDPAAEVAGHAAEDDAD